MCVVEKDDDVMMTRMWTRSRVVGPLELGLLPPMPMDSLRQGKGCSRSCSTGFPRKRANHEARSRAVRVDGVRTVFHLS